MEDKGKTNRSPRKPGTDGDRPAVRGQSSHGIGVGTILTTPYQIPKTEYTQLRRTEKISDDQLPFRV